MNDNNITQSRTATNQSAGTFGVGSGEREEILLDDVRVQLKRLADAVERQNELIAQADSLEVEK